MSGIVGWIAAPHRAPDTAAAVPMLEALAHRGTGGAGLFEFDNRGTRHRVVIAQRGPEPLYDPQARLALAFDGTLDNRDELRAQLALRGHAFEGTGDAEVLLRAYQHWDKDAVKQLRGQFAFALWDANKDRLLLARDRFGEKPLYLHERDGSLFFASEAKALLKVPGIPIQVDAAALHDCLAYRYVPGPRTLFAGVRKLPPATYSLWQFGRLRETRYWSAPDRGPAASGESSDPVAGFVGRLDEVVKLQVGQGSAGVFLSGGIDSAVLLALAIRHAAKVSTFSLGLAEECSSELPRAAELAKHFGSEHHEVVLPARELADSLPRLVAWRDAPISVPSDLALYALAREAGHSVHTVVTGEGGDEILGGYRRHVAERFAWGLRSFTGTLGLLAPLARSAGLATASETLRLPDWRERCARWVGALTAEETEVLTAVKGAAPKFNGEAPFDVDPRASALRRALYFDQTSWLPDNLLERTDRLAAAASVDARAPFVDYQIAEYVSGLPDALRVRGLSTKWILRQAARHLIPSRMPGRRKRGFPEPAGGWLRGELRDMTVDCLRGPGSITRSYYDAPVLDRMLDDHLKSKHNHDKLLWTLLNLEIWHRTYLRA